MVSVGIRLRESRRCEVKGRLRTGCWEGNIEFIPVDDVGSEAFGFWITDRPGRIGDQKSEPLDGGDGFTRRVRDTAVKVCLTHRYIAPK